jgi:L-fucose dehydrogenase
MDLGLKDKIIIVTGGAKCIGAGIAKALSAEGAIPVVIGRNQEDNDACIKETG